MCVCFPPCAGYANEVGEAFRALVPVSFVWGSYAVATAYVTADAVDKGKKAAVVRCQFLGGFRIFQNEKIVFITDEMFG